MLPLSRAAHSRLTRRWPLAELERMKVDTELRQPGALTGGGNLTRRFKTTALAAPQDV